MKQMSCRDIGGACDKMFQAETFKELAIQSKMHANEMIEQNDQPHIDAMEAMKKLMVDPKVMQDWFAKKKDAFEASPDIS